MVKISNINNHLNYTKLNLVAMVDKNTEEWQRRRVKRLFEKVWEASSPENFSLPIYVNVDTSPEEPSDAHEKVTKRKSLKYVDDRAGVADTDEESSSVGSDNDEITHASMSLSSSSSDE